jgi:2-hydroxy-4-carboxymuconate semialdehyde hemiacetal dehydrogenase
MECSVLVETEPGQSLLVHGSYHAAYRFHDELIVTNRETYFLDILANTLRTEQETVAIENERDNCARVVYDFIDAVRDNRSPLASGPAVLPAMRVLQSVQDQWDARYGSQSLPGRPLD